MITNDNKKVAKKVANYFCEKCDYFTANKTNYEKHLETDKHKNAEMITNDNKKMQKKYNCKICVFSTNNKCNYLKHVYDQENMCAPTLAW